MDSLSLSNTISKQTVLENTSMTYASLEDAKRRENDAISNERIKNGDTILDTYEVTSDAISGGMGSVWRVHHQSWNTDLAMKRPQPRFFAEGSESRKEQFIKECENWINLGLHPNIVSCYYVREIGGVPTIFSEWMDNGSLKDRIADGSLYEGTEEEVQERILDIAIQAARGLQYSHDNGLIHQDMKPGNLLLSKEWDAKVADFGLAKAKEQLDDKSDTAKTTGYTLAYCPKEQSDGEEPQKWMDVYAWALTVLEMYAGKRLWDTGADAKEHLDEYFSKREHKIPDELKDLLRSCLNDKSDGFDDIEKKLIAVFLQVAKETYPRKNYLSETTSVDNLNNYAMSMIDLGLDDVAEAAWNKAVEFNPNHTQSVINRVFFMWDRAKMTDIEVKETLALLPDSPEKTAAMEKYELERGSMIQTDDGLAQADMVLLSNAKIYDGDYENKERVWLAAGRELKGYDTSTGKQVESLTTGERISLNYVAFSSDKRYLYSGSTGNLIAFDRNNGNSEHPVELTPSGPERFSAFPHQEEDTSSAPHIWRKIWLEDNDKTLCAIEHITVLSPIGMPAEACRCYILKYHMDTPFSGRLTEARGIQLFMDNVLLPLPEQDPEDRWYIEFHHDGSPMFRDENFGWEVDTIGPLLRDKMTGRCVRSGIEYARMRQDQRQFLSITYQGEMYTGPTGPNGLPSPIALHKARQLNYYSKMYTATLCAVPEFDKKNRLFELSRIKSVSDLLHNVDVARELKLEFEKSMERGSYKEAIRCFEQYRELPDRADSETCMRMELRLSKKCPRLRLNSYSTPADVNIGFDMSPLESDWMDARDDRCKEAAKIAEAIAEKKSPISCVDENGKEIKIQGYCTALLVKSDLSSAYVIIEKDKKDIDILSEEGNAVFEIDLNKKKIKQVYYGGKRRIAVAPNGTTLAIHGVNWYNLQKLHASIPMVIRDGVSSEYKIAGGECGRVSFSPDSDFLLCSSEHALLLKKEAYENLKHYIIGLIPISEKEPYTVEKTVLPMCEGQPVFSADGLHLLAADNEKTVPWLRLSWDYSVPGKGSKRTEVVDSNKEKERLEEEAKRKIEKEEKKKEKKGKKEERAAHTKQLRGCFLTIAFYILLISILTGFILNLIWAGNISSVIKDGNSVIGTAIRDSDFFLSPSVTLEYTVDEEQYEVKNTMRFDKIDTDGAEDDSDRRKVEIFYESDHPEKAYTRDTLALAELRRTIFLIAFIVLEAIRLVAFIRYRRKNRKYYSKHPIV